MFGLSKKILTSSMISKDMKIKGTIKSETEIYNDGIIEGDIFSKVLVIGINGKVISNSIKTEKIIVYGMVEGNIDSNSVYLGTTARVNGNILNNDISIENGAFVSGKITQKRKK